MQLEPNDLQKLKELLEKAVANLEDPHFDHIAVAIEVLPTWIASFETSPEYIFEYQWLLEGLLTAGRLIGINKALAVINKIVLAHNKYHKRELLDSSSVGGISVTETAGLTAECIHRLSKTVVCNKPEEKLDIEDPWQVAATILACFAGEVYIYNTISSYKDFFKSINKIGSHLDYKAMLNSMLTSPVTIELVKQNTAAATSKKSAEITPQFNLSKNNIETASQQDTINEQQYDNAEAFFEEYIALIETYTNTNTEGTDEEYMSGLNEIVLHETILRDAVEKFIENSHSYIVKKRDDFKPKEPSKLFLGYTHTNRTRKFSL